MKSVITLTIIMFFIAGCVAPVQKNLNRDETGWKGEFNKMLPLLGHRNWVLVVDKAFPLQNSGGITVIYTGEKLIPVLQYVIKQVNESSHVAPVFYNDAELKYLLPEQVRGLEVFRESASKVLAGLELKPILHDSVFVKTDVAARLFRIVVLKTDETIPYSSVFIELGCKYWSGENEKVLRKRMEEQ